MLKHTRTRRRFFHQTMPLEKTAILDAPDMGIAFKHLMVLLVVIPLLSAAAYGVTRLVGIVETNRTLGPVSESR